MDKFSNINSSDTLKRSINAPSIAMIGHSSSGKSTLIASFVNPQISKLISNGIGGKSQTTIIPTKIIFREER